jgi:diadenosine tetraphosphate (Ap4A) HIT family hydrolase
MAGDKSCEFCELSMVLLQDELAYARYDNNSLAPGHVLVIPRRHVANFFDMTAQEKAAVLALLDRAQAIVAEEHRPDGYNIGVNVGTAGGQSRMHVHVHLIPRYTGDVADPRGGIRCVLAGCKTTTH